VPPADFAARFPTNWSDIEHSADAPATRSRLRFLPSFRSLAAAAVLLLCIGLGVRSGWRSRPAPGPQRVAHIDSEALTSALAEATSATWDLARTTSVPAARVGLEVFDAVALSESPAPLSIPAEVGSTSNVLEDVGRRVNDEVGPLTGTARHAFGFLIGAGGG
jgi:hypothetical protein